MADNTGCANTGKIQEAVCIETRKVYDSCRDRECIEDLRVYFTPGAQDIIEHSASVRPKCAEVLWTYIDVEPVPFNNGYFTIDIRFFFKISVEVCSCGKALILDGLAIFNKRSMLFGSEGGARTFTSQFVPDTCADLQRTGSNLPEATLELVDPVILAAEIRENCCCNCCDCGSEELEAIPEAICSCFDGCFVACPDRRLFVTIGLFSIIRLSRKVQLLMPVYDFCIPECENVATAVEPCDLFERFQFPLEEFFPPERKGNSITR